MAFFSSLYGRLTIHLLWVFVVLSLVVLYVWSNSSQRYAEEVTQRLNRSLAMYVTDAHELVSDGKVDQVELNKLIQRAMVVNPSAQIYILDGNGRVVSPDIGRDLHVNLLPIHQFLEPDAVLPIYGDDPSKIGQKQVFSVSPILEDGRTSAYLYTVLGGVPEQSFFEQIQSSHILKIAGLMLLVSLIFVLFSSGLIFYLLTKRLRDLTERVGHFQFQDYDNLPSIDYPPPYPDSDEVEVLNQTIKAMMLHIRRQFKQVKSLDNTRRELVENMAHDLRTPLASLQGYIETCLLKKDEIGAKEQERYLNIAYKNSIQLSQMIEDLFEFSKLNSGAIQPKLESFSIAELIQDAVLEHQALAESKNIELCFVQNPDAYDSYQICADIALIQRALQNLILNAINHNDRGTRVTLSVFCEGNKIRVGIKDEGDGIEEKELPHIFDRFYSPGGGAGTGLGLSIVKKIMDLHGATVSVQSCSHEGTTFTMEFEA